MRPLPVSKVFPLSLPFPHNLCITTVTLFMSNVVPLPLFIIFPVTVFSIFPIWSHLYHNLCSQPFQLFTLTIFPLACLCSVPLSHSIPELIIVQFCCEGLRKLINPYTPVLIIYFKYKIQTKTQHQLNFLTQY